MVPPYLFGIGMLAVVWLLTYSLAPALRRELVTMSVLGALFFPIHNFYYLKDYWHPDYLFPFRFEDILLMFFMTGIAVTLYPFLSRARAVTLAKGSRLVAAVVFFIAVFGIVFFASFMNSVYAADIGFILAILIVWVCVPGMIKESIITGGLFFLLAIAAYGALYAFYPQLVGQWWRLENLSGYFIFHLPIEEHVWDVLFAMAIYPVYKIATRKKYD